MFVEQLNFTKKEHAITMSLKPLCSGPHNAYFPEGYILLGHQHHKYVLQRVCKSSNGLVILGKEEKESKPVAIKISKIFIENKKRLRAESENPFMLTLINEEHFYNLIHALAPPSINEYFPRVLDSFESRCPVTEKPVRCLVLEKFGQSLPNEEKFSLNLISFLAKQIFESIAFMHSIKLVHGDLAPSNILIDEKTCQIKIIDLGMTFKDSEQIKDTIQTFPYRAPEVSLKIEHHSNSIDLWSIGCILTEWASGEIIFRSSELDEQIEYFSKYLGSIPKEMLKNDIKCENLAKQAEPVHLIEFLKAHLEASRKAEQLINLIVKLLKYNPSERISAAEALKDPFFA